MQCICDNVMEDSNLLSRFDKNLGKVYIRTSRSTGLKYQVVRSTGKHTNAALCCLSWFRQNMNDFVRNRRLHLNEREKISFFRAICESVKQGNAEFELIHLAQRIHEFLTSETILNLSEMHTRNFADLILCALSKNQQHVKAVAANYRKNAISFHQPPQSQATTAAESILSTTCNTSTTEV